MTAEPNIRITKHAEQRIRKRFGINKRAVDSHAAKAFKYGTHWKNCRGALRNYMEKTIDKQEGAANNAKVYNQYVYLFRGTMLITILQLPRRHHEAARQIKLNKGKYAENKGFQSE